MLLSCSPLVWPQLICLLSYHVLNHFLDLLICLSSIKVKIHCGHNFLVLPIIVPSIGLLVSPLSNSPVSADVLAVPPPSWHVAVLVVAALVMMVVYLSLHLGLFKTLLFLLLAFRLPIFQRLIDLLTDFNLNTLSLSIIQIWNSHGA